MGRHEWAVYDIGKTKYIVTFPLGLNVIEIACGISGF